MVVFRVIIGTIWVSLLVLGRGMLMANDPAPSAMSTAGRRPPTADGHTDEYREAGRMSAPRLDRYGNPIERAVGDYRTDPRGDLYERHAPDTAVLDPGPPTL